YFPGFDIRVPMDSSDYAALLVDAFPHEADAIRSFLELCGEVHRQAHELPPRISFDNLDWAAERFPILFRYQRATAAEAIDEHLGDDRLKALVGAPWPYLAAPPSQLSFVTLAQYLSVTSQG